MRRAASWSFLICCFVILLAVSAEHSAVEALCPQPPTRTCAGSNPICLAKPSSLVCSLDASKACVADAQCSPGTCVAAASVAVGGTVTAHPNNIQSVALSGAVNVTLVTSSLPSGAVTFRAFQTNPAADGSATVTATAIGGATCTVPVSFRNRASGAPVSEVVCPTAENYSLEAFSGPASPAGFSVCSWHLADCDPDIPLSMYLATDSRVLSVRSPISGNPVVTDLIRGGTFDPNLRLVYARSTDSGATYSSYADVTTATFSSSTRIRGTPQWSDVRFFAGSSPNLSCVGDAATTPTMGEWAMAFLILLMATASSVLLTRRRLAPAGAGPGEAPVPPLFVPQIFVRTLAATVALTFAGLAVFAWIDLAPGSADVAGSLACAVVLAYLVHFWAAQSKGSSGG